MDHTKEKKAKLQITMSAMILTGILIAELFVLNQGYAEEIFSVIFGIVALVAVYVMINAIMTINAEKEALRQMHFENLYKSEKASYIMLKNKFEEIETKLAVLQESSRIPSEEIINAQKGIAKVIINRSKENADAIINSNDQVLERLDEIDETQNTKFTGISKDQRLKLQDMVLQLKDMELRLNQAIMQGGGKQVIVSTSQADTFPNIDNIPEAEELPEVEDFPIIEEALIEEPISAPELDLSDPNKAMSPDDIAALFASMGGAADPVVEETIIEEPIIEEPISAPGIDLSDPNKAMSPDDIAALFASMGGAADPVAEEPIMEEPIIEEAIVEEPISAPELDLSDPNKAMSPDDIAALFASMAGTSEPEPVMEEPVMEEIPPMPDMSDPNKVMSPDEIAALIANL